uniref:Tyr recombinase domain-containing protein n=1 Tax=Amphimedon queenslandica TaxID=400682 RepID=A0A1X7TJP6_AMPQE
MRGRLGKTPRLRLPITSSILRKMKGVWAQEREYERSLWWAVALTAFFGFCRSGEITVPQGRVYDPQVHLSFRDLAVDNSLHPNVISLLLHCSKTDQERRGVRIILGRTDADLCPVSALLKYLVHRGRGPGALFMLDGEPLERTRLVEEVCRTHTRAGLPAGNFAGHSFHIGAATTASAIGVEDSTIQTLGRWKSAAFKLYVRPSTSHLAGISRSLAQSNL